VGKMTFPRGASKYLALHDVPKDAMLHGRLTFS
jgi:hypothetical protein